MAKKRNQGKTSRGKSQQEFFKRIDHPGNFRKNLLGASKSTLGVLKQIYRISQIREKKQELIKETSNELKEIKGLFNKVQELMPGYSLEEVKKKINKKKPKPVFDAEKSARKIHAPTLKVAESEIDKITKNLDQVEQKLRTL